MKQLQGLCNSEGSVSLGSFSLLTPPNTHYPFAVLFLKSRLSTKTACIYYFCLSISLLAFHAVAGMILRLWKIKLEKDRVELSKMGASPDRRGVCVSRNMALYAGKWLIGTKLISVRAWECVPGQHRAGFLWYLLHRLASSTASMAFIVLLVHGFKLFHLNRPRYTHFSIHLAGFSSLILMFTPVQQFAAQFNDYLPDSPHRDLPSSNDFGRELSADTGWQSELPGAIYPGSKLEVTAETPQLRNEIPQEELAKALQEIGERIAPDHISELQQKGKVEYAKQHLGPDWQTSLHDDASKSLPKDPGFKPPLAVTIVVEAGRWGSIVVKAMLVAIAINLKRISL